MLLKDIPEKLDHSSEKRGPWRPLEKGRMAPAGNLTATADARRVRRLLGGLETGGPLRGSDFRRGRTHTKLAYRRS